MANGNSTNTGAVRRKSISPRSCTRMTWRPGASRLRTRFVVDRSSKRSVSALRVWRFRVVNGLPKPKPFHCSTNRLELRPVVQCIMPPFVERARLGAVSSPSVGTADRSSWKDCPIIRSPPAVCVRWDKRRCWDYMTIFDFYRHNKREPIQLGHRLTKRFQVN